MVQDSTFGQRLKAARDAKKLRQRDLAEKANITESMISRYERDISEPGSKYLERLAVALGVTPNKLLGTTRVTKSEAVSS